MNVVTSSKDLRMTSSSSKDLYKRRLRLNKETLLRLCFDDWNEGTSCTPYDSTALLCYPSEMLC